MKTDEVPAKQKAFLTPIDFSASSIHALRHAVQMAEEQSANLILLNVVEEVPSIRSLDTLGEEHESRRRHTEHLAEVERQFCRPGTHTRLIVRKGAAAREIVRVAAQEHVDLIVMGRRRHSGLSKWFHGRTSQRILGAASCPVMILTVEEAQAEVQTENHCIKNA